MCLVLLEDTCSCGSGLVPVELALSLCEEGWRPSWRAVLVKGVSFLERVYSVLRGILVGVGVSLSEEVWYLWRGTSLWEGAFPCESGRAFQR